MKLSALLLVSGSAVFAQQPSVVPLWSGVAPGSESWTQQEEEMTDPPSDIRRIRNIVRPTLTVYLPERGQANGTAVIVCPGGAFRFLAIDHEGYEVARWLNSLGVAAFVLKYRVMLTGDPGEKDKATMAERRKTILPIVVADGQQAVRVVRSHAAEWGVAPDRIGIMGFSAGGYVTSGVLLQHDAESRPNFAAPIYPAVPEEVNVPADAPPVFLVHADDDKTVSALNHSVRLYTALKKAQASVEMHIYSKGGHGFGMRKRNAPVDGWTDRMREWLDAQGLLKAPK